MIDKEKLKEIFTGDQITDDLVILESYARDISFVNRVRPSLVVRPQCSLQVEQLVKLANETGIPLVPVSSGAPHFRGDTVPGIGGAIIVDMSGMNKVIRADRTNRVVMFEPGVTFGELIAATKAVGLRINMPMMPRATKSVVGSLLEREPVILPKYHWDITDPLCDIEIVLGNGQLFRTGAAAGPGTLEEQWKVGGAQKEAAGPSSNSWYRLIQGSQGSMGIVTWASARCEILPQMEEPFLVGSSNLNKIMEMVHWLIRLRLVNECLILNKTNLAAILTSDYKDFVTLREELPDWILFYNVAAYDYFPMMHIRGQVDDIWDLSQKHGVEPRKALGSVSAGRLLTLVRAPSDTPYWKLRLKGASQDIFCLSNFQKVSPLVNCMCQVATRYSLANGDLGVYIQPLVQGVNYHVEFNIFYDSSNSRETAQIKALVTAGTQSLLNQGGFFSRPYGETGTLIMNRNASSVEALKKVKKILDPNNVMNPGKLCF